MTIAHVSESFKIEKLEVFYDPGAIFNQLAISNNMKTEYLSQEGGEEQLKESGFQNERADWRDLEATGRTVTAGNCPMRPKLPTANVRRLSSSGFSTDCLLSPAVAHHIVILVFSSFHHL